jgi:hypothetical protein
MFICAAIDGGFKVFEKMTLGIVDLLVAAIPVIVSIIGLWFKMNNLVVRQDIKIENLDLELREMKRHNEKQEEKIATKLDAIDEKITAIQLHFVSCVNYKPKG